MGNLVIVAIPSETDPVWKVSTEKVPHITLLFLGDSENPNRGQIAQFMIHAANLGLDRFGLEVDRRGELGADKADVLFFDDTWELPKLTLFRNLLLQNDAIRTAYDSVEQFPEWQPHLTLGYPKKPARDNAVDYPINYVQFDRIALWDKDYEGVELILKRYQYPMEVSMSSINEERAKQGLDFISHHGVKGMKWGVRKERSSEVSVTVNPTKKKTNKKIKTSGGQDLPPHKDAVQAQVSKQVAKKSGTAALSNHELQDLARRLQLEQQVRSLTYNEKSGAKKFIARLLGDAGKQQAQRVANEKAAQGVSKMMAKKAAKGAAAAALA